MQSKNASGLFEKLETNVVAADSYEGLLSSMFQKVAASIVMGRGKRNCIKVIAITSATAIAVPTTNPPFVRVVMVSLCLKILKLPGSEIYLQLEDEGRLI
ncbi:hypothetical protein AVEN_188310-1 [Araneus ventricosus]|uniref:Uncharacterized protein n=1 Tax=Araneus ventricosus TaxID=182803 RepID=A0A4Y2L3L2_ARAVE|nr:hypothetical protein AVEN_188310-1 [Araneus ventricosus]